MRQAYESGYALWRRFGFLASPAFGVTCFGGAERAADMSPDEWQQGQPTAGEERTSILLEISNTMVRLYKDQFGRGPTRARSHWAGPDAVICFLEDTLTPAERNLVRMGQHQRLRDMRLFFQYATVREFCAPVEQITGRKVRSFHSSVDTKVDGLALETFVFYREGEDGPSRIELTGDDEV
jgi:uncharacterized protein YbcI